MTKKSLKISSIVIVVIIILFWRILPDTLFEDPYAHVMVDRNDQLLAAHIAADGQWRFPATKTVPEKFEACILHFEDRYFYRHPGVNPLAIIRAIRQNIESGRIVSGASTLTMQVIRMSRKNKRRSWSEKMMEMIMAFRLELSYSKKEILAMYASHAPFGGNTVGLEAAAWRYYGTQASQLSWGESALLAVLPNQPALLYPGRQNEALRQKRDRLLFTLYQQDVISKGTYTVALEEPIPSKPKPLPQMATHLLDRLIVQDPHQPTHKTTVAYSKQVRAQQILQRHQAALSQNHIHNASVLVADIHTGEVLAYVANSATLPEHHTYVDLIQSLRSPGSTLKPFLYAAALDEGIILPASLLPDIPTYYQGFTPKNFSLEYDGAVPANEALARSLNIPFVRLLQQYSYPKFNYLLKQSGITSLNQSADHYGLSIILGGAEVNLWELMNTYALMIQKGTGQQSLYALHSLPNHRTQASIPLSTQACWYTLQALMEVNRPGEEGAWRHFVGGQEVAWKTGTSFGFKDAWAIGSTPDFMVGVWVGNADGEGRPELIGSKAAGPILFDVLGGLPSETKFRQPNFELKEIKVCRQSGYKAGQDCTETEWHWLLPQAQSNSPCPFHKSIYLDESGQRAHRQCAESEIQLVSFFSLPPDQARYYKEKHPSYLSIPSWSLSCMPDNTNGNMSLIYPSAETQVFIPKELEGNPGQVIFEVAHAQPHQKIHWHLNEAYVGTTSDQHKFSTHLSKGLYTLTLVDDVGERLSRSFEVVSE